MLFSERARQEQAPVPGRYGGMVSEIEARGRRGDGERF